MCVLTLFVAAPVYVLHLHKYKYKYTKVSYSHVSSCPADRAISRKSAKSAAPAAVDDTDIGTGDDIAAFEEEGIAGNGSALLDDPENTGAPMLTAFNLKEEREEGFFDEEGNYVFKKEEANADDPWLDSDEGRYR